MIRVLPFVSLDGASDLGAGTSRDLEGVLSNHGLIVAATGNPTLMNVALEGSHDGVTWVRFATASGSTPAAGFVDGRPVRHVRANLTALDGGTSPTVTATVASS